MARKKKPSLSTAFAFMSDEAQSQLEAEQTDRTTTLPLAVILPDPDQPRRLLPGDLAEAVAAGALAPNQAVQQWVARAERDPAEASVKRNVYELKRLATSIEQHGLINPISVRPPGPDESLPPGITHLIVTGERRFWAFVYLLSQGRLIQEGDTLTDPSEIKVTLAPPGVTVRAHQVIENLMREDINAIERARGMWALRYELSGVNRGSPPAEVNQEPDSEEDMIEGVNQVNHGSPPGVEAKLVPWTRVEEVLGISKRYRIFSISVLKLCPEAQELVETHSFAERTIRPIAQKLKDKPELQVKALRQLVAWQDRDKDEAEGAANSMTGAVAELVDRLLAEAAQPAPGDSPRVSRAVSSAPVIRFRNKVRQTLDFLNRLKREDRTSLSETLKRQEFADVMLDLRNLRQQIDILLAQTEQRPAEATGDAAETEADR